MRRRFDVLQDGVPDRGGLMRMAMLYVPLAAISGAGVVWLLPVLIGGDFGALIGLTVLGLGLFGTTFQATGALRDLRAAPIMTTGVVLRKRRPGLFMWLGRTHYLILRAGAFVVSVPAYHELEEGDEVEIEHWPHTHRVIRLRLLRRAAEVSAESGDSPPGRGDDDVETAAAGGVGGPADERSAGWRPPHVR